MKKTRREDLVLTVDELAEYLNVSKSLVYQLIKNGDIPVHRFSYRWRFLESEITEWLDSKKA